MDIRIYTEGNHLIIKDMTSGLTSDSILSICDLEDLLKISNEYITIFWNNFQKEKDAE